MLFQPSNILPDVINGMGNGTIDVSDGLTVSWQINGNSHMSGYSIAVYQNDTASTLLYTTTTYDTSSDPTASAVDYMGNIQRFQAATISSATLTSNGITNGNTYKLCITQNQSGGDPVVQRSMSVFKTRNTPTVSIASITDDTLETRNGTFTGTYTQAQGDVLTWARWQLYNNTGETDLTSTFEKNLIKDTGKMYGVTALKLDYDSFLNNNNYNLVLSVETENGIEASTSYQFEASWEVEEVVGTHVATADRINRQSTAIKVEWGGLQNIPGEMQNTSITNGVAHIGYQDGANTVYGSILWDTVNGESLTIDEPWMLVMRFRTMRGDASFSFLNSNSSDGFEVKYTYSNRSATPPVQRLLEFGTLGDLYPEDSVNSEELITLFIYKTRTASMDAIYTAIRREGVHGGLEPTSTLQPSSALTPKEATVPYALEKVVIASMGSEIPLPEISSVQASGLVEVDYIQVISGDDFVTAEARSRIFNSAIHGNTYYPENGVNDGTVFLVTFDDGTADAGNTNVGGSVVEGWAVYREHNQMNMLVHLIDVNVNSYRIFDYGCGSNNGKYRYAIYPIIEKNGVAIYGTNGVQTRWIEPCFENWAIIEARKEDAGYYTVINEFVFGKNFSSGSVSNNNAPTIAHNFTRYATVQMSNVNYQSGTLSGLIGYIGYIQYIVQEGETLTEIATRFKTTEEKILEVNPSLSSTTEVKAGTTIKIIIGDGVATYYDDKVLRDAIWALSTTRNHLFLKSRKGDMIEIRIAGEISMETMDASPWQPISASVPWVQVGEASMFGIVGGLIEE